MDPDESNIFQKLLSSTPVAVVDVVGMKRKNLKLILDSALTFISTSNYLNAAKNYEEALNILKNDPYPDEYDFTLQEVVIMKYLLCYNYLLGGIKVNFAQNYLQELENSYGHFERICTEVFFQTTRANVCLSSLIKGLFAMLDKLKPEFWNESYRSLFAVHVSQFDVSVPSKWSTLTGSEPDIVSSDLKIDAPEFVLTPKTFKDEAVGIDKRLTFSKQSQTLMTSVKHKHIQTDTKVAMNVQTQTKESHFRDHFAMTQHMKQHNETLNEVKKLMTDFVGLLFKKLETKEKQHNQQVKSLESEIQELNTKIYEQNKIIASITFQSTKLTAELENLKKGEDEMLALLKTRNEDDSELKSLVSTYEANKFLNRDKTIGSDPTRLPRSPTPQENHHSFIVRTPRVEKEPPQDTQTVEQRKQEDNNNGAPQIEEWLLQEIAKLSHEVIDRGSINYWRLIIFLKFQIPDQPDVVLADMVDKFRASRGKLSGMSREVICEEVKKMLEEQKFQRRRSAWKTEKPWDGGEQGCECSICYTDFDCGVTKILGCQHKFHKDCIEQWLTQNSVCPLCRKFAVSEYAFPPLQTK